MKRNAWRWPLLAVWLAALLELVSWLGGRVLARGGVVYRPPGLEGFGAYLAQRDPLLGWPPPGVFGGEVYDARGARRVAAEAAGADGPPCGAAFGDSFTFGDEVEAHEAWPHQLGLRLGCRVANYGVGGYGTDQALLRFRARFQEDVGFVVLAHFSENLVRNLNRYRGFLTGGPFGWKPRFRLDAAGALALVPMPEVPLEALPRFGLETPPLPDDWFAPGGPGGTVALRFPYTAAIARLPWHYRVQARLRGEPAWAPFYAPDHPSGALPLTAAILEAFAAEARARGQAGVVMAIPDQADLRAAQADGRLPFAPLLSALDARGVPRPGLAEAMLRELDGRDPCAFFLRCDGGHLSPAGHAFVADVLARFLHERRAAPPARAQRGPA